MTLVTVLSGLAVLALLVWVTYRLGRISAFKEVAQDASETKDKQLQAVANRPSFADRLRDKDV